MEWNLLRQFPDSTKVGGNALTIRDCLAIQKDLDEFKVRCPSKLTNAFMDFGTRNNSYTYNIPSEPLRVKKKFLASS